MSKKIEKQGKKVNRLKCKQIIMDVFFFFCNSKEQVSLFVKRDVKPIKHLINYLHARPNTCSSYLLFNLYLFTSIRLRCQFYNYS